MLLTKIKWVNGLSLMIQKLETVNYKTKKVMKETGKVEKMMNQKNVVDPNDNNLIVPIRQDGLCYLIALRKGFTMDRHRDILII